MSVKGGIGAVVHYFEVTYRNLLHLFNLFNEAVGDRVVNEIVAADEMRYSRRNYNGRSKLTPVPQNSQELDRD
jgi:hypothetical protein